MAEVGLRMEEAAAQSPRKRPPCVEAAEAQGHHDPRPLHRNDMWLCSGNRWQGRHCGDRGYDTAGSTGLPLRNASSRASCSDLTSLLAKEPGRAALGPFAPVGDLHGVRDLTIREGNHRMEELPVSLPLKQQRS